MAITKTVHVWIVTLMTISYFTSQNHSLENIFKDLALLMPIRLIFNGIRNPICSFNGHDFQEFHFMAIIFSIQFVTAIKYEFRIVIIGMKKTETWSYGPLGIKFVFNGHEF